MNTLKTLINKLDELTRQSLEQAASLCLSRSHYNIELEHWLLALIEQDDSIFKHMLNALSIDLSTLAQDIHQRLETFKTGNDQTPAISERIVELINAAWLLASLDYEQTQVHSGFLACVLTENTLLNQIALSISSTFSLFDKEQIRLVMAECEKNHLIQRKNPINSTQFKQDALQRFTVNLNEQAKNGHIDEVIGREDEIRQVIDILSRRRQNNAILTGEPGVGKTAIAEGFARRIVNTDVPKALQSVVIHALDIGLLQAGASVKGEFENRLKALISEVKSAPHPIILFIDEAHALLGHGAGTGQNDAANLLKPALARGELRCIAATTWSEYKRYIEKDPALTRRFQVVKVAEPDTDKAIAILRSLVPSLEKHHGIRILDSAVVKATTLAKRYITERQLPDKSISVLDTACARVARQQDTTPALIENLHKLLLCLKKEQKHLKNEINLGLQDNTTLMALNQSIKAHEKKLLNFNKDWQREKKWVNDIHKITEKIDLLSQNRTKPVKSLPGLQQKIARLMQRLHDAQQHTALIAPFVDEQVVAMVIADWTGIPIGNMINDPQQHSISLQARLKQRIIAQDHALCAIQSAIHVSSAKLVDPNKPLGIFLFVGPSGVGKTETAIALAESLYGKKENMTVINMSEFKEEYKISTLTGSPPGYVGYGEGGVLTEAVRKKPYSLILLDEMEKAHSGIQDVFYQVFDKGILKDAEGQDINFKNTLIIMTSNACTESISRLCEQSASLPSSELIYEAIKEELSQTFKPAFLGRVTVVPYLPLSDTNLKDIISLKLDIIAKRLQNEHNISLVYTEHLSNHIATQCYHGAIGARQIDTILNKTLLPALSTRILNALADGIQLKSMQISIDNQGDLSYKLKELPRKKPLAQQKRVRKTLAKIH